MAWLGRGRNGTATLVIEDHRVSINVTGLLRLISGTERVEKRSGDVAVSHVRLRPPWMSTVVRLDDSSSFSVGMFAGRRVADRLRRAGFSVSEERVTARPTPTSLEPATRIT